MHVDDPDQLSAAHDRDREKGLVRVFHQGLKPLETGVGSCIRSQRHHGLVLRHPAGDAFADLQPQIAEGRRVRHLRSPQDDFA